MWCGAEKQTEEQYMMTPFVLKKHPRTVVLEMCAILDISSSFPGCRLPRSDVHHCISWLNPQIGLPQPPDKQSGPQAVDLKLYHHDVSSVVSV